MSIFASSVFGLLFAWYVWISFTVFEIPKKNKILGSIITFVGVVVVMEIFFSVVGL